MKNSIRRFVTRPTRQAGPGIPARPIASALQALRDTQRASPAALFESCENRTLFSVSLIAADFDGDGYRDDQLAHDQRTGETTLITDAGTARESRSAGWQMAPTFWSVEARDADGDGRDDLLWSIGDNPGYTWYVDGTDFQTYPFAAGAAAAAPTAPLSPGPGYELLGAGDFDGDGLDDDGLWYDPWSSATRFTVNDGGRIQIGNGWFMVTEGRNVRLEDLTGDGRDDVIWSDGYGYDIYWVMNGTEFVHATPNTLWQHAGRPATPATPAACCS